LTYVNIDPVDDATMAYDVKHSIVRTVRMTFTRTLAGGYK